MFFRNIKRTVVYLCIPAPLFFTLVKVLYRHKSKNSHSVSIFFCSLPLFFCHLCFSVVFGSLDRFLPSILQYFVFISISTNKINHNPIMLLQKYHRYTLSPLYFPIIVISSKIFTSSDVFHAEVFCVSTILFRHTKKRTAEVEFSAVRCYLSILFYPPICFSSRSMSVRLGFRGLVVVVTSAKAASMIVSCSCLNRAIS